VRIRGEIIDQIRKQDWAPISVRQKIKKIEEGMSQLELRNGRSATEAEVAEFIAMDVDDVRKALGESHTFNLICLDELLMDHMDNESLASNEHSPEDQVEDEELKQTLAHYVDSLPERERMVLSLYYQDELTLKEIGGVLGVTESRVCQIHSKSIASLRTYMKKLFEN
jgi:RNA polymerase sigma factor for flagellar operon FliA